MAWTPPFDPFQALGLPRDATTATVRTRYRELAWKYHPNRHQSSEPSQLVPSEHFQQIQAAWEHLNGTDKRRRYEELLHLADEHAAVLARTADLVDSIVQQAASQHADSPAHDGHVSSDADEDELPRAIGLKRRTTFDRQTSNSQHLGDVPEIPTSLKRNGSLSGRAKLQSSAFNALKVAISEHESGDGDYFAIRRKKLDHLRRKELAAFTTYREAMMHKFEAELEAERSKELYERATWKRDYFERAPKETAQRVRSFQQFMGAVRAFGQPAPKRRGRSTLSHGSQILSTTDIAEEGQHLAPDSILSPTSRSKGSHHRGWSSDITGDQTSSDDASGVDRPSPRIGLSGTWDRRHSRNTSLEAFANPLKARPLNDHAVRVPQHEPFKMLVKRPTGFQDHIDNADSSPETASLSSRSTSPMPPMENSNGYTLKSVSTAVSVKYPRGDRTIDGVVIPHSYSNGTSIHHKLGAISHFMTKHIRDAQHQRVVMNRVHELDYKQKCRLLGSQADVEHNPTELVERLSHLDQNVASRFEVKPDIKETFRFRLVCGHEDVKAHHQSFIALSYRRRLHVERKDGYFSLPLEQEMFQAVWDERASDFEGLWVDQICIDQDSEVERTVSMSAMDMVYRSARLIVVCLDDIQFEVHEGDVLESHMDEYARMLHVPPTKRFRGKQPPYLETRDVLYQVVDKLLRSSWFRRAWCRHEMRLARDHVFLIPCKSPGSWTGRKIIRFSGQCLAHLLSLAIEVPFDSKVELVKPALHAFFRDRSKLDGTTVSLQAHHGNFTTVSAEVLSMEAGGDPRIPFKQRAADAIKDKIAIILNTMECGLTLAPEMRDPSVTLSRSECHYMLLLLALAARDSGALSSVGPPMRLIQAEAPSPSASSTWMFEPTNVDSGLNNYRTLNRLPSTCHVGTGIEGGEHFVRLDLSFLQAKTSRTALESPEALVLAERIIRFCEDGPVKLGRNRQRYLISDRAANTHFGSMRDVYLQTLACILECGPDWLEDICHRYGVSRWRQDLEGAWNLLVALKSTLGRWPESAWTKAAAGFIMDFVNFIIVRGMPQRQIIHSEHWRPIWMLTQGGGKILTFVPPGQVCVAVPTALLDPDYVYLARLWILTPNRSAPFQSNSSAMDWTLLGKSVVFSDDKAMEELQTETKGWRREQKVFGRDDAAIQRMLRERSFLHS